MTDNVSQVHVAKLFFIAEAPHDLVLLAWGKAATPGWSNPRLEPRRYPFPPEDGIQDFDFVADAPDGLSIEVLTPIFAADIQQIDALSYWGAERPLKGARIHAKGGTSIVAAPVQIALGSGEEIL